MENSLLCSAFPHLYHLSLFKNCLVSGFLGLVGELYVLFFFFRRHLSNRETTEVASFLSLLDECNSRARRRNIHVWSPNPIEWFCCNRLLPDPSHVSEPVFDVVWRIPKKIKFFTWQVLLGQVNTLDRLVRKTFSLIGPFYNIFYWKVEKYLHQFSGSVNFVELFSIGV